MSETVSCNSIDRLTWVEDDHLDERIQNVMQSERGFCRFREDHCVSHILERLHRTDGPNHLTPDVAT